MTTGRINQVADRDQAARTSPTPLFFFFSGLAGLLLEPSRPLFRAGAFVSSASARRRPGPEEPGRARFPRFPFERRLLNLPSVPRLASRPHRRLPRVRSRGAGRRARGLATAFHGARWEERPSGAPPGEGGTRRRGSAHASRFGSGVVPREGFGAKAAALRIRTNSHVRWCHLRKNLPRGVLATVVVHRGEPPRGRPSLA